MSSKPKVETELDFLAALERGEVVTQMTLSKRLGVAVGLINALLKRAIHKGYVKTKAAPYKRYAYYVTPKGFAEKSTLVAQYLNESLAFFRIAREEYAEQFRQARNAGARRAVFAGGGELAEIALMAAREADIEVGAILDPATNKDQLHGLPVLRSIEELPVTDAVFVTESRQPQAVFDQLRKTFEDSRIFAPRMLRITRVLPEFKPNLAREVIRRK